MFWKTRRPGAEAIEFFWGLEGPSLTNAAEQQIHRSSPPLPREQHAWAKQAGAIAPT
jgi:hypothetical protein